VPENVSICYRGANYAIGQGRQFYGIWHAASTISPPLEWWPHTPDGWSAAWSRFAAIEVPGTIGPVTEPVTSAVAPTAAAEGPEAPVATKKSVIIAALIGVGIALGVAGLFPTYLDGSSLAQLPENLVLHVIYLAAWSVSGVLIALGGTRLRVGSLLGIGVSAVTFGLFLADAGTPISGGASLMGAGLVLSILGWLACTAGTVLAFVLSGSGRSLRRPAGHEVVPTVTLMLAALGAAIAFAPSWDSFTLRTLTGATQTLTEGNAFANPAPVIIGDVVVMVALLAVVVIAALWRRIRLGAALAAGAVIPMVAQAISAIVMIRQPTSPQQFGITQSQASQVGLTIDAGLTPMFWVFCAFLVTLILLCVWMLVTPDSVASTARPDQPLGSPANPEVAAQESAGAGAQPSAAP
jgi:uncharacterized membrane protein YagU involved in acid resistance